MPGRHLLILDTVGVQVHTRRATAYRALLPDVYIHAGDHPYAHTEVEAAHDHGAWCGWLAGVALQTQAERQPDVEFHLHFLPMFDAEGKAYSDAINLTLHYLNKVHAEYHPDWIGTCRAWGSSDNDQPLTVSGQRANWEHNDTRWWHTKERLGFVDVAAAGNSDQNDADPDVVSPQAHMGWESAIIGASDRRGLPTSFTGDGPNVLGLMWGKDIISPGLSADWTLWSGSSASCAKAAGVACAYGFTQAQLNRHFQDTPYVPESGTIPHPKWGYGNREDSWQTFYTPYLKAGHMPVLQKTPHVSQEQLP